VSLKKIKQEVSLSVREIADALGANKIVPNVIKHKSKSKLNFYPFNHKDCILIKDNKAILSCDSHLCGYVALPVDQVPVEWYGEYNADALQYLNIHGGITFCEVYSNDIGYKYFESKAVEEINGIQETDFMKRMDLRKEIIQKYNKEIVKLNDSYIVFGFDCNHYRDENNAELKDINYVMLLTQDMEDQLLTYSKSIDIWRQANKEEKIKLMDVIRERSIVKEELGFGAMIGILGGAKEFKNENE
jgi:hypothetical protein